VSVAILAAAAVFAVGFLLSLRRPWAGVLVCVALLPWSGVEVDPGIRLTAYRLVLFGWIAALAVRGLSRMRRRTPTSGEGRLSLWGIAFLAYATVWSLVQLAFVPTSDVAGSALRAVPQFRSIGQIAWFLLRFAPLLLLPAVLSRMEQGVTATRVYLGSLALLAVVGFVQLGVWTATGVDVAPIGGVAELLGGDAGVRHGIFAAFGRRLLRMSSFGGEPKGLGQSLAVGLLLLQAGWFVTGTRPKRLAVLWVLLFVAMLTTVSTSALYVWSGGTVLLVGYLALARPAGRASVPLYTLGLGASCLLVVTVLVSAAGLTPAEFGDVLAARTVDRRLIPDFDLAVWGFLLEHPAWGVVGVGLGNVHTYAASHIPEFARRYMESSVFVAKSGYLRLLSEVGVVGLVLFLVWMWRELLAYWRRPLRRAAVAGRPPVRDEGEAATFRVLAVGFVGVMVLAFMARGYLWDEAVWSVAVVRSIRTGGHP
jgi:hypothetical protein